MPDRTSLSNNICILRRFKVWCLFASCIMIASCSALQVPPTGFLSHYDQLRPVPKEDDVLYWEHAGINWKQYKRLMIEPIDVRIQTASSEYDLSKEEMERLAGDLHKALVEGLGTRFPITDQPAQGVMRVRVALTHLKPVRPAMNITSTVAIGVPIDVGEAAVEAQFIDATSGMILAELTANSRGSIIDITRVWTRWDQVDHAFKLWVKRLKSVMEE